MEHAMACNRKGILERQAMGKNLPRLGFELASSNQVSFSDVNLQVGHFPFDVFSTPQI